ncbi:hypothetical protein [Nucisporomicrobium flavum]|uniref:hypothetical protein n=1 Tax=Nucisporomicrobium flavum TaxID=2785915 RepID=UPI0018F746D4|nr:hypothetical protein [Nucisporomicrobium flavum]
MINPGTLPIDDAREDLAAANLQAFLDEAHRRGADHVGTPERDHGADRDGRFGWNLPMGDGTVVRLLMPGVEVTRVRDDLTASAPCLYLNGGAWWWRDAVGLLVSPTRWSTTSRSSTV